MDILGQSSLLVAVVSFALGFSVLARNVKNKLFIAFAVTCTLISFWALMFFLEIIWPASGFYRLHLIFNVWLAPAVLWFIRVLIRLQDDKFSRRLLDVSFVVAVPLTAALFFRMESYAWILNIIYFAPGFIMAQIFELMLIDVRHRRAGKRIARLSTVGFGKRDLVYAGGLLVLVFSVMDHVPWTGRLLPSLGNLGLAGFLFFISQAISQQRLLNFGALFSRFLVLIAVALTLTFVYSLLVAWIQDSPSLFFLNSFIASFLILMLLEPLRKLVGYFTRRLLTQKQQMLEQFLEEAQRKLTGIVDAPVLFQSILVTVEQTLQPGRAALFVLRSDGTKFRRVRAVGHEPQEQPASGIAQPPLREILADNVLLAQCERMRRQGELPVLLEQFIENEIDRSASRVQKDFLGRLIHGLKALECNLLIPLFDSGRILGFVTVHAPSPPEPWGGNWGLLHAVYPYFELAGHTLRNMEVYVRQREKDRLAELGEMSAGLAHEIRNPLGAIKGAAQFLDPSADRPESRFLKVIIEEADRLNKVVTQFLDYSKPQAAEYKNVDLNDLVARTVEILRPGMREGVVLEFTPSKEPLEVVASPERIRQVVLNIIRNSEKALKEKLKGYIKVSVDVAGGEVVVSVEDNGCGIKKENLEKIFIPFFTTSPEGTGLGLPICQKIIEAHKGRIELASEEGRFTRFSIVLPEAPGSQQSGNGVHSGA